MRFPVVAIALLCLPSLPACDAQECEDHAVGMFPLLACGNYDFHGQADGEPFRCTFSYDCLGSEGDTTFSPGPCSGPVRLEGGPSITPVFPGTPAVIDWVLERTGYPDGEHETTQGTAVPSYRRKDGCQVAFVPIADGA